jgi:arginine-tRNA-protein transferase
MYKSIFLNTILPQDFDTLLACGWRHFGTDFYCYSHSYYQERRVGVLPLRIPLQKIEKEKNFPDYLPKWLRKIANKNKPFQVKIEPIVITEQVEALFEKHKRKYTHNIPDSIYTFLSPQNPAQIPLPALMVGVYEGEKLIACSFLDIGHKAVSSVYAMYDLDYAAYSLGYFTMLLEIDFAKKENKEFYYHGYSYDVPSHYDYKKRLPYVEFYSWTQEKWFDLKTNEFQTDTKS